MGYSKLHFAEGCTGVREHRSLNVKVQAFLLPIAGPSVSRLGQSTIENYLGGYGRKGSNRSYRTSSPVWFAGTTLSKLSQRTLRPSSRHLLPG